MRLKTLLFSLVLATVLDAEELSGNGDTTSAKLDSSTLKLVHVLFRHGDRSQTHKYKNDIYSESSWPQGYGQLTKTGIRQEYDLGEFLRKSYVGTFLDPEYRRGQVYARSTNFDRTLMSAYSVLAGLFPPGKENGWSEEIAWQPIPVHTVPANTDDLLLTNLHCPLFVEKQKEFQTNQAFHEAVTINKEMIDYIVNKSGETDPSRFHIVMDSIFCQNASGFTLPQWVTPETLKAIVTLRNVYSSVEWPPHYAYLKGGVLLGQILNHMIDRTLQPNYQQKLYMYSAHDTSVVGLLATLGVYDNIHPPYAAAVIVELHELSGNRYVVRVLFRNESGRVPYTLQLPGCDKLCPLNKFGTLYESSIVLDIKVACQVLDSSSTSWFTGPESPASTIAAGIMTAFLLLMVLIVVCVMWLLRKHGNHDYRPVPLEMSDMEDS